MEQFIFTVFDSAAGAYLEPFFAPSIEFAIRGFREAVNKKDHQFNKFPEDYTLFQVGAWDPKKGVLEPCAPHSLGVALAFIEKAATPMEVVTNGVDRDWETY